MANTKSVYREPKLRTWGTVEDLTLIGPHNAGMDACEGSGGGMPKAVTKVLPCTSDHPDN